MENNHKNRDEKSDQENRDDYLCSYSFTRGIRLLACMNHRVPACHYPVKFSGVITHESTAPDFRCLVRFLCHVATALNHNTRCAVKRAGIIDGIGLNRYSSAIENDSSAIL